MNIQLTKRMRTNLFALLLATLAPALATAGQRPISDFVSRQGHWCINGFDALGNPVCPGNYGPLGCGISFVPPAPNFIGWSQPPNAVPGLPSVPFYFVSMDYAGEINEYLGGALGTTVSGSINEVANPDGTATVAVTLHTHNALAFASVCDAAGNLCDFANTPLVFGARLTDVLKGAAPSLGDCTFYVKFINTAPGAPLPDLLQLFYCPDPGQGPVLTLSFVGQANGTLAVNGVPNTGGAGSMTCVQKGLLSVSSNPHSRVSRDAFPAERIFIQATSQ